MSLINAKIKVGDKISLKADSTHGTTPAALFTERAALVEALLAHAEEWRAKVQPPEAAELQKLLDERELAKQRCQQAEAAIAALTDGTGFRQIMETNEIADEDVVVEVEGQYVSPLVHQLEGADVPGKLRLSTRVRTLDRATVVEQDAMDLALYTDVRLSGTASNSLRAYQYDDVDLPVAQEATHWSDVTDDDAEEEDN